MEKYSGGIGSGGHVAFVDAIAEAEGGFPGGSMCSRHLIIIIERVNCDYFNESLFKSSEVYSVDGECGMVGEGDQT